jgi:hypothetical protein
MLEIARKRTPGVQPVNLFGVDRAIGTGDFETIWNGPDPHAFPATAGTLTLSSSSSSDTMPVLIQGLDSDYNMIDAMVTLNGTSDVTTTESFWRVNSATILSGENQGNISIDRGDNTVAYIETGNGTTQACVYTVPAGHELFLFRIDLTSGTVRFNRYLMYRNVTRSSNGRVLRVAEATWQEGMQSFDRQIPFRIPEKTDFFFEAKSSANPVNEVSIFIEALLMEK